MTAERRDVSRSRRWLLVPIGGVIGFLGSVVGIGGGLFATPILHFGFGLSLRRSIATSLTLIFATAATATLAEFVRADSAIEWRIVVALLVSGLVGAQVGYLISKRIDPRLLRWIFCVVLVLAGTRVLFTDSGEPSEALREDLVLGWFDFSVALISGFLAGLLAPLLGIGGGILVVPALFIAIPGLGYLGARATSLAMATANSMRSTWMYAQEDSVEFALAPMLAGGAAIGAALGVIAVHQPGWATAARNLMGSVLFVVAGRFAWDLRRPEPSR